tara:strand:- start:51 stop:284 length:234 start_codon:yes stop_codon:yes gene_type:complete
MAIIRPSSRGGGASARELDDPLEVLFFARLRSTQFFAQGSETEKRAGLHSVEYPVGAVLGLRLDISGPADRQQSDAP